MQFASVLVRPFLSVAPSPDKMLRSAQQVLPLQGGGSALLCRHEGHLLPWKTKGKLIEAPWDTVPLLKILSELKDGKVLP